MTPPEPTPPQAAIRTRIEALCRHIQEHADERLSLHALAQRVGLSPHHLQRSFKAATGVTPKQYAEACRVARLKQGLREGESVTQAIYDAGFGSPSRVYERVATRLGMTPGQYREGGRGVALSYAISETPLGLLIMAASDRGLCFVQFGQSQDELRERLVREYPGAQIAPMDPAAQPQLAGWMQSLAAHLLGHRPRLDLPLDLRGTAFQMKVWAYLQSIPYGELRSYTEVAAAIGHPAAVRAVASACAANRVGVLVPCHRVLRGDGAMGGYRWGIERKRALIELERATRPTAP